MSKKRIREAILALEAEGKEIAAKVSEGTATAEELTRLEAIPDLIREQKAEFEKVVAAERRGAEAVAALESASADVDEFPSPPVTPANGAVTDSVREGWMDDPQCGFQSLADQALAIQRIGPQGHITDPRLLFLAEASGMQQGVGADGGVLLAPAFRQRIWDRIQQDNTDLLSRTDQWPMGPGEESLRIPAIDEKSRKNGNRFGGIDSKWKSEAEQMVASKPKLREMKLEPEELYVFAYGTDKLIRNSAAVSSFLERAAAEEISFKSSDSIMRGTGAGQPKGMLNDGGCKIIASKEAGQAANTIVHKNISKMWVRLHPRAREGAVWLANPEIESELDGLYVPVTNVAGSENVGGFSQKLYNPDTGRMKGREVIFTDLAEALGTEGDLVLTNLSYYATAVRGGIRAAMSIHLRFDYNETAFRWIFEMDGQPWLASAITPYRGNQTLSTVVTLETRS